jgi:NAD(P)-dependent dehydrogenase (short-subunit alcohol dehydrogenase family)
MRNSETGKPTFTPSPVAGVGHGLLRGKVVVVSGIGPGMGRDIALASVREGARVVLVARRSEKLEEVAAEISSISGESIMVSADVTIAEDCLAVASRAVEAFGRIDVLVNNAFHDGDYRALMDADLAVWRDVMEVNFFGSLHMTRAVVPTMQSQRDGRIVMINTQSSLWTKPNYGAYASSKAALAQVTKTLARELGPSGIRVNGIHPGFIWGPSVQGYLQHRADSRGVPFDDEYDQVASETCLGYLPDSAEITGSVIFLASDLARPVTGQWFAVNAGQYLP